MIEVKAKQRPIESAILLDQLTDVGIKSWADQINTDNWVEYLSTDNELAFQLGDLTIYKKGDYHATFYYAFNNTEHSRKYKIVFFAQVQKSTSSNPIFKAGMHQSLIWKAPGFANNFQFSTRFLTKLIESSKEWLMADMKQTFYGRVMWISLLLALYKKYDCYYALFAQNNAKCIIKTENARDIDHYENDIVQPGSMYAYRTVFILKKGIDPRKVLKDPERTLIFTCEKAEKKGIFTSPKVLTE